jgi:hypothetical protein
MFAKRKARTARRTGANTMTDTELTLIAAPALGG